MFGPQSNIFALTRVVTFWTLMRLFFMHLLFSCLCLYPVIFEGGIFNLLCYTFRRLPERREAQGI